MNNKIGSLQICPHCGKEVEINAYSFVIYHDKVITFTPEELLSFIEKHYEE